MFCTNCGNKVKEGSNFCLKCGYKIVNQDNNAMADRVNSVDTNNKVSKIINQKSKQKSKLPVFLIILVFIIALVFGATYFVTKENPFNILLNKIDEIRYYINNNLIIQKSNFDAELKKNQVDTNVLGENVHVEGADVYQNPDGSIQIGGTPNEGAMLVQSGDNTAVNNELQYDYSKPPIIDNEQIVIDINDIRVDSNEYAIGWDYNNKFAIGISLTDQGKEKYKKATERNLGRTIYVIYNGNKISSIFVNEIFNLDGFPFIVEDKNTGEKIVDEINSGNCDLKLVEGDLTWPLLNETNN